MFDFPLNEWFSAMTGNPLSSTVKSKGLELFFADMQCVDFADIWVVIAFADDQYGFRLIAHLRADMPPYIVVPFVKMEHTMDMQIIQGRPLHHLVDDFHRFTGIIDVEHQVADAVDDDQTVAFVLT